jgi:hypothetical protein
MGYPGSAQSRMCSGSRFDLVARPPVRRHQRAGVGPHGNLTGGYEKAEHRRSRGQLLLARLQQLPCSCFSACADIRQRMNSPGPRWSETSYLITDREPAAERAAADVVPRCCRQLVVQSETSAFEIVVTNTTRNPADPPGEIPRSELHSRCAATLSGSHIPRPLSPSRGLRGSSTPRETERRTR